MSSAAGAIQALGQRLPLAVLKIEWNDPNLVVGGAGWSISVLTPWRIVLDDRLLLGSDDATQSAVEEFISGKAIVACEVQSRHSSLDPALIFDSGIALEIFSVTHLEPWVLLIAEQGMFVASPSE
jgi:hypothetical protein